MALTEETVIDQLTVDEYGNVGVRRTTRILRDGVVIAQQYHRSVVSRHDDERGLHPRVRAIVKAARAAPDPKE